jgi:membrane-associated HD superfamily phosphohydrolase
MVPFKIDFYRYIKRLIPKTEHAFYITLYNILSVLFIVVYTEIYFGASKKYDKKYLSLIITVRNILLSLFLIYFYNPLRSNFNFGPALPIFATGAGFVLLFSISRFDILNLVHFCLYGVLLENPASNNPECRIDDATIAKKALQVSKAVH